jgi:hypothetical protein
VINVGVPIDHMTPLTFFIVKVLCLRVRTLERTNVVAELTLNDDVLGTLYQVNEFVFNLQ